MALSRETHRQIIEAAKKAHAEGRPLFNPKPDPKPTPQKHARLLEAFQALDGDAQPVETNEPANPAPKPEFSVDEIFAQMQNLCGTIR